MTHFREVGIRTTNAVGGSLNSMSALYFSQSCSISIKDKNFDYSVLVDYFYD